MTPIWQDIKLASSPEQHMDFYVTKGEGGEVVFEGRVDKVPGESNFIPSNDICKDFLKMEYPADTGVTVHPDACGYFGFYRKSDNAQVGGIEFIYDWSYERTPVFAYNILTKPINGHADPRMKMFVTSYSYAPSKLIIL